MAKGARVVRKSAPTRSKIRCHVGRPWADQCGDERLCKRTEVLRESSKSGTEGTTRAGSKRCVTKAAEELAVMRMAHFLICAVPLFLCPPSFAQERSGRQSTKQDAPKVIATDDMKLAMKAGKLEAAGKYDEALK